MVIDALVFINFIVMMVLENINHKIYIMKYKLKNKKSHRSKIENIEPEYL